MPKDFKIFITSKITASISIPVSAENEEEAYEAAREVAFASSLTDWTIEEEESEWEPIGE
jgi:hypothetical protein